MIKKSFIRAHKRTFNETNRVEKLKIGLDIGSTTISVVLDGITICYKYIRMALLKITKKARSLIPVYRAHLSRIRHASFFRLGMNGLA
jgi:activator of 2-hydroxyglutaryl-CoA dehydratase